VATGSRSRDIIADVNQAAAVLAHPHVCDAVADIQPGRIGAFIRTSACVGHPPDRCPGHGDDLAIKSVELTVWSAGMDRSMQAAFLLMCMR
jgi:hypothetical protein